MIKVFCDVCGTEIGDGGNYSANMNRERIVHESFTLGVDIHVVNMDTAGPGHLCGRCYSEIVFKTLPFQVDFATGLAVTSEVRF